MADAAPQAAPSGDAARADGDKGSRRSRGGKNRATAGAGDAAGAENDAVKAPRPPKGAGGGGAKPRAAAAGQATEEAQVDAAKQPRERRPRERKPPKGTAEASGEATTTATTAPPPAPAAATREARPAKKQHAPKPERKKKEPKAATTAAPSGDDEAKAEKPTKTDPEGKNKRQNPKKAKKAQEDRADGDAAEDEDDEAVDWSTAAWFSGCDADLGTGHWLLTRSYACNDVAVLASEALVRRAVALQKLHARLKTELLPQDEPEGEDDGEPKLKPVEWTTTEILDAAVAALPPTDKSSDAPESKAVGSSKVVSLLEGEVVDVATELLIGRVGREHLELLVRWDAHLATLLSEPVAVKAKSTSAKVEADGVQEDVAEGASSGDEDDEVEEEVPDTSNDVDGTVITADDPEGTTTTEPGAIVLPPPRQRGHRGAGATNSAIAHAKAQVTAAIAFHRSYEKQAQESSPDASKADVTAASTAQWTHEITTIFEATRVNATDEARRKGVAAQIESAFRRSSQWRHHEVLLFGSSLSKFGSKTSDLDLCLRATNVDPEETNAVMSVRELKLRMRRTQQQQDGSLPSGDGTSRNDDAPFLKELLDKSLKTVEALINTVKKQRKKTANKSDAKVRRLALLLAHWKAIVVALEFFHGKLSSAGADDVSASTTTQREAKAAAAAYHAALYKQQKKRQKDIYAASALLTRNGCDVDLVVAHARVPVIGFTHKASGFECDLCFENYHACINTLLLRTYAECDDRARMLGVAVKHWAKRRGINDASLGFLSSYSFILLVIYFLQHKARLLPNLQHAELLREANVEPMALNGVDVSFCGAIAKAKVFHTAQLEKQGSIALDGATSVGTLLLAFFRFYVEEFDFSQHVVSVRHPETLMNKASRWGRNKLKTWRFSIEDPLELDRDLGSVLQFRCQQRIVEEMKRALKLLRDGQSFETAVCEAEPDAKKNDSAKQAAKKKAKKEPHHQKKSGAQGDRKKEAPRDKKAGGDHNGRKTTAADGTRQGAAAKDGSNNAPPSDDKKPDSSRGRRTDRHPAREKPASADSTTPNAVNNNQDGERPPRERTGHEKGGRRRPRGDGAKSKDAAASGTPKAAEA